MSIIKFDKSKKRKKLFSSPGQPIIYNPKPLRGSKRIFKKLQDQYVDDDNKIFRRLMNGLVILFVLGLCGLFYMNHKHITFKQIFNL